MINAIIGDIVSVSAHQVFILAGGVEYTLEVSGQSASKYSSLQEKKGVRVLTELQHRQDSMVLFGFSDEAERNCFRQLQTVPGIGPKQALKILSGITVNRFVQALDARDVSLLSKISGIGPKTGQKLILQLRNVLVYDDEEPNVAGAKKQKHEFQDLLDSLTDMGFDKKIVSRELNTACEENKVRISSLDRDSAEAFLFPLMLKRLS